MKKFLLPVILVLMGIGGGAFVGTTMKPETEEKSAEAKGDALDKEDSHNKQKSNTTSHRLETAALDIKGPREDVDYVDLPKQFVIPLVNAEGKRSLIVLQLQIEIDKDKAELAEIHAPKLRDAFLRTLLELSDTGAFENSVTSRATLEDVRYELKRAAQNILGKSVHGVLIEQLMRQDV